MGVTAKPLVTRAKDAPAYWQIGNLWKVMVTGVQSDNSFSLLDQIVHAGDGGGPTTHTHTQDEGLYVVKGGCTFNAGGNDGLKAGTGTLVAIPGMCEHSFTVDLPDTHLLNFYLPAGFELIIMGISSPALIDAPPPPTIPPPDPALSEKLSAQYGMEAGHQGSLVFRDPPDASKMATRATPGATVLPFLANATDSGFPAYWSPEGGLQVVLASGARTGGSYCMVEQTVGKGRGAAPHFFEGGDEVFYILEGEVRFLMNEKIELVGKGDLVFVPRGAVSGFTVDSAVMRCLHLCTPAGFERFVECVAEVARERELPPADLKAKEVDLKHKERILNEIGLHFLAVGNPFS